VCPTGVDIRNGVQLGCIQCGLCIDACDAVMAQINRPAGLIAYDTDINAERRIAGKAPVYRLIRPRTILYAAVIAVVGSIMLYTLATRSSMSISALHERSPLAVTLSDGSVRNDYTVRFLNKAGLTRAFALEVVDLPAAEIRTAGIQRSADGRLIVEVEPDQTREVRVSVQVPAAQLPKEATDLEFRATDIATGQTASVRDHFVLAGR
jgi:cytochrome c oxidase accessory protein FixG